MKRFLLDTNILLRFLLDDHAELSKKARHIFKQADQNACALVLSDVAIAEAVWVLKSFYELTRADISSQLSLLVQQEGIEC